MPPFRGARVPRELPVDPCSGEVTDPGRDWTLARCMVGVGWRAITASVDNLREKRGRSVREAWKKGGRSVREACEVSIR